MNLTDRIYVAVHIALTVLVCVRPQHVEHWPWYVAWNLCAIVVILLLARKKRDGTAWTFSHDWLPAVFFITVFEEVSYLSLSIRGGWNDPYVAFTEGLLFNGPPAVWMHAHAAPWLVQLMAFGYFAFYPLYPIVGGLFWAWRERPSFANAFRRLTDALSVRLFGLLCDVSALPDPQPSKHCRHPAIRGRAGRSVPGAGAAHSKPRGRARQRVSQRTHHVGVRGPDVSPTAFCRALRRGCCSRFC